MALAAFNVFDLDTIRAVVDAAKELEQKIYLQFSASTVKYYGASKLARMVDLGCSFDRSMVIVHLDHCNDKQLISDCINHGWDSVMADYSHLSLEKNIEKMLAIKDLIGSKSIMIEGELGQISGVEDGHGVDVGSMVAPEDVVKFVTNAAVDLLAIGIGNAHGFYKSTNGINIDLLKEIHNLVPKQQLVLHGGTGIEEEKIKEMKKYGIVKINISTELKNEYILASQKHSSGDEKFNMIGLVNSRYEQVKQMAKQKIRLFK